MLYNLSYQKIINEKLKSYIIKEELRRNYAEKRI